MKPHGRAVRPFIPASATTALAVALFLAAARPAVADAPALIPAPERIEAGQGWFTFDAATRIVVEPALDGGRELADLCQAELSRSTGLPLPIQAAVGPAAESNALVFAASEAAAEPGPEGYTLTISPSAVYIRAAGAAGWFYGYQTLRQLLPVEIYGTHRAEGIAWRAPALTVTDRPRFAWRGYMLDVARHYFDRDAVKRVIDALAMHKLNVLHMHLTDLNAWRLVIEKYPKLTAPEVTRAHYYKGPYETYFTRADIRELVAYARARHITVVPEIDMPGHSRAAVTAYPEIGEGGAFNPACEDTYSFLKDVLSEVMELFPSSYVHIGADEARLPESLLTRPDAQAYMARHGLKTLKDLEGHFDAIMTDFIVAQGKIPCAWEEAGQFDLDRSLIVFWWMGLRVKAALDKGHRVVACPYSYAYLSQAEDCGEYGTVNYDAPPGLTLRRLYEWEPTDGLTARAAGQIIGVQACLWTPLLRFEKGRHLEYKTFPRLAALADVAWAPKEMRGDYDGFRARLDRQFKRYRHMDLYYRNPVDLIRIGEWGPASDDGGLEPLTLDLTPHLREAQTIGILFRIERDAASWDRIRTLELLENDTVLAAARRLYFYSYPSDMLKNHVFRFEVNPYRAGASYRIRAVARPGHRFEATVFLRPHVQPETYDDSWPYWDARRGCLLHEQADPPPQPGKNLLRNSSFEEDLSAPYIDYWTVLYPEHAVLDDALARDGARSARLVPNGYNRGLTYKYLTNLEPGQTCTFSIWARGETPESLLLAYVGPASTEPRGVCTVLRVGPDWQRLAWTFVLPAGPEPGPQRVQLGLMNPECYYPEWTTGTLPGTPRGTRLSDEPDQIVVTPKNGRIWLDAAQLEAGGATTPYQPGPPSRNGAP